MDTVPTLDVQLLGAFATRVGGRTVPAAVWQQRRAAAIVKLLALESGHRLHREQLLDALWPELDPDSAANNLRGALHHARRGLEQVGAPPGVFLVRDGDQLLLGAQERLVIDVEAFGEAASRAWQNAEPAAAEYAAGLYTGDLLPDDPYEDWAAARREGLRASYLALLTRLARLYEEHGKLSQAIAVHERILLTDPLEEAAHARLMQLHAQMGNGSLALAQYARLQSLLDRELGTGPQPETQALAATIRTGRLAPALVSVAPSRAAPPPSTAAIAPSARLPVPVDALLGRDQELAELELLLEAARLVTLTGPGGIGKTRLALGAARVCRAQFPDGVAFVDLAPLRDPAFVLPTMARALGIDETGARPNSELLAASIGERRLLLVLDNFEHLTEAGPGVAALLESCPHLSVLSTSRMRLRLRGEREYPVQPLALPQGPERRSTSSLGELARVPAIALFAQRATAARPGFTLTDGNIDPIVAICWRLDGLPLAIELAAAQVRVLAPAQLVQRLGRPLDVLGTTAQDIPARQRTLRSTIAWSHDLLTSQEQILFRRLSVFVGGWSLDGAEAIASISGDTSMIDTVETLSGLIDHSLIETRSGSDGAELRYAMLETIREFASEQLTASGEAEPVERSFEAFLIGQAEAAKKELKGPDQLLWLGRLEAEDANLRAAMSRALDRGDGAVALSLALRLWEFWETRGYLREGRAWLERTLTLARSVDAGDRAAAESALGRLSFDLGDYDAAEAHYQKSLEARRQLGDAIAEAEVLSALAKIAVNRLAYDKANELGEESLKISRKSGDRRGMASALQVLGMVAREQGQYDRALELFEESMALGQALGDTAWTARITSQIGFTHRLAGNAEQAQHFLATSKRIHSELGDRFALGTIANDQGHLAFDAGDIDGAIGQYAEALQHFDAVGGSEALVEAIEWLAVAVAAKGKTVPALRLFGAAAAAREALRLPPRLESDEQRVALGLDRAMQAAGASANAALAEGRSMSLEHARDEALELATVVAVSAKADS